MKCYYSRKKFKIKIVDSDEQNMVLTDNDKEMDRRARKAVKTAIEKARFCNKPVAKYDALTKQAYIVYGNGESKYVK